MVPHLSVYGAVVEEARLSSVLNVREFAVQGLDFSPSSGDCPGFLRPLDGGVKRNELV